MGLNRTRVELKHVMARNADIEHWVWIEPEWNWNRKERLKLAARKTVWIEPEWNWNNLLVTQAWGTTWGLNRTRVELKPMCWGRSYSRWHRFESNQSGIETCHSCVGPNTAATFESNQSGIETNCTVFPVRLMGWFESNQSGIETDKHARICAGSAASLNRTRVELKLIDSSIRGKPLLLVWIEPEWNWNRYLCWWWNHFVSGFESNQSGIETRPSFPQCFQRFLFESNQSGIETFCKS